MLPFDINLPTLLLLALIVAWAVWAVRRIAGRGLCDCGDHCSGGCGGCSSCSLRGESGACASFSAVDPSAFEGERAPKRP